MKMPREVLMFVASRLKRGALSPQFIHAQPDGRGGYLWEVTSIPYLALLIVARATREGDQTIIDRLEG